VRPCYFDFEPDGSRRATAIMAFERAARRGWRPLPPRRGPSMLLHDAVNLIRLWRRRVHERRQLVQLDLHLLRDIGVTLSDAQREAAKPFWRA
jgi:uncharacterized protein YjiS (DUF1127 family)